MNFFKIFFLLTVFSIASLELAAQDDEDAPRRGSRVIDDTTKQVYGPTTTRYYYERDVFLNRTHFHVIDTVIRNFHRFSDVHRNENLYQDLGNIGTAIRPIYYDIPSTIGVSSGCNTRDVYWDREEIRHYDTKSPYTNMNVIIGGGGRSLTRATYSRNVNPQWNVGFSYRGLFSDKQIGRQGRGDRNVRSHYYDFHTAYETKDSTYRLFFDFRRMNHLVIENGGVRLGDDPVNIEDYFDQFAEPALLQARNTDLRMNLHLYHQYKIGKALQVYHQFDRYRQADRYTDRPSLEPEDYFDYVVIPGDTTNDRTYFRTVRNEVGIKGNISKFFYNGYVALRDYGMTYSRDATTTNLGRRGTESYLGGRIGFMLDSLIEVSGLAEIMPTGTSASGNYRFEGVIRSKWFEATLKQSQYEPSFLQQRYRGAHDLWENNFSSINATRLSGYLHYRSPVVSLSPGLTFARIGNYVFFKEMEVTDVVGQTRTDVMPVQSPSEQVIFSPMLRGGLTVLRHIHLRSHIIYSQLLAQSDNAIQLPKLFVNGQLSYENIFFKGNLDLHFGVDVHWKSDYYALGYDVPIQQFYVQQATPKGSRDLFLTPAFPIVDGFINAKIKRARIFFKYNNIVQALTGEGYFPTPRYPGQRNVLDFGFDWSFYD